MSKKSKDKVQDDGIEHNTPHPTEEFVVWDDQKQAWVPRKLSYADFPHQDVTSFQGAMDTYIRDNPGYVETLELYGTTEESQTEASEMWAKSAQAAS
jgi:hypothetical protein